MAITIKTILDILKKNNPKTDLELVELAYNYADEAHKGQTRKSGEPYIEHPLHTALTLAQMGMDEKVIAAALLHDVPEDSNKTIEDIKQNFGEDIANMVDGITKLGTVKYRGIERYIENIRKMFIAMAQDIRVILIKFADRLHNLETLGALPPEKQQRIAREVMEIYAPIASRLGIWELKVRLEDMAFKYLMPKEYEWTSNLFEEHYQKQKDYADEINKTTKKLLQENGIKVADVNSRVKSLYRLYKKLLRHDKDISKIYDLVACRIVVEKLEDCYAALGIIHKKYKPLRGRIKDYIAQPKINGYQSLHTTVFGEEGRVVEFQIRTKQMNSEAEFGIAAHWNYEGEGSAPLNPKLKWVGELAQWKKEVEENKKILEDLKLDMFKDRIFVFTPNGDIIDLPEEATPIDFAYHVHTEIGNKCTSALINNQIAKLDAPLRNGDVVEIIIDKNRKGPNEEWLTFAKTNQAKNKIKAALNKEKKWSINIWPFK